MRNTSICFFIALLLLSMIFQSCKIYGEDQLEMNSLSGILNEKAWMGVAKIEEAWNGKGHLSLGFTLGAEEEYNQIIYINSIEHKVDVEQKLRSPQGRKEFCASFTTLQPGYRPGDYYELDERDDFADYVKITKFDSETQEIEGIIQASFSRYTGHPKRDNLAEHLIFKEGKFRARLIEK